MEHPGAKHHRERMGSSIREEISAIIEGELGDPRIGLVGVSEVQMAPDGRSARVYINVDGDDEEAERSLQGLNNARAYIRRELTGRLQVRLAPELFFTLDRSDQYGSRIDQLLDRVKKRNR
jgi:ribosome-binding factor A